MIFETLNSYFFNSFWRKRDKVFKRFSIWNNAWPPCLCWLGLLPAMHAVETAHYGGLRFDASASLPWAGIVSAYPGYPLLLPDGVGT